MAYEKMSFADANRNREIVRLWEKILSRNFSIRLDVLNVLKCSFLFTCQSPASIFKWAECFTCIGQLKCGCDFLGRA